MPSTTPDNIRYPNGPTKVGRLWQHFKNLADDTQLALNSLTNQHIECVAAKSNIPILVVARVGQFSVDPQLSSNTQMASFPGDGVIRIAAPGVYALSSFTNMDQGTGRSFVEVSTTPNDNGLLQRIPIPVGEDKGSLSLPNLRITQPNTDLYFNIYRHQSQPASESRTRVRITKMGRI